MNSFWAVIKSIYNNITKNYSLNDPLNFLPMDMIQQIHNRLDLVSRCRFAAVSRNWREAYVNTLAVAPNVNDPPWVLLAVSNSHTTDPSYKLFNTSIGTQHKIEEIPYNGHMIQCTHGTFLVVSSSNSEHFLYNPFSKKRITLPQLVFEGAHEEKVYNLVLSCDSSDQEEANLHKDIRWMVASATLTNNGGTQIYLSQPHTGSLWQKLSYVDTDIQGMIFHQSRLYGIIIQRHLIFSSPMLTFPLAANIELSFFQVKYPDSVNSMLKNYVKSADYLVNCDGELLVVRRLHDNISQPRNVKVFFQVFKLLEEEMAVGLSNGANFAKVVQVNDLGDKMLFLSRSSICISSKSISCQHYSGFFKSSCIYYFYRRERTLTGVGRFDLKDNSVCNIVLPSSDHPFINHAPPFWVIPPLK